MNDAYATFNSDLAKLRKDAKGEDARDVIAEAATDLKQIRQDAVKAIHESGTCDKDGDEDADEDEDSDDDADSDDSDDEDGASQAGKNGKGSENWLTKFVTRLFGGPVTVTVVTTSQSPSPSATASPSASPVASGEDPQSIADNAVAAMQLVFDTAKADLEALGASEASSSQGGEKSNKGKSGDRGRAPDRGGDDDEEDDD